MLAPPVPQAFVSELQRRGIRHQAGQCLVNASAGDASRLLDGLSGGLPGGDLCVGDAPQPLGAPIDRREIGCDDRPQQFLRIHELLPHRGFQAWNLRGRAADARHHPESHDDRASRPLFMSAPGCGDVRDG